eukprot:763394-Hanusia_phi.AAC.3
MYRRSAVVHFVAIGKFLIGNFKGRNSSSTKSSHFGNVTVSIFANRSTCSKHVKLQQSRGASANKEIFAVFAGEMAQKRHAVQHAVVQMRLDCPSKHNLYPHTGQDLEEERGRIGGDERREVSKRKRALQRK